MTELEQLARAVGLGESQIRSRRTPASAIERAFERRQRAAMIADPRFEYAEIVRRGFDAYLVSDALGQFQRFGVTAANDARVERRLRTPRQLHQRCNFEFHIAG